MSTPQPLPPHDEVGDGVLPFLSHSRIHRYLQCPEQYRLYYIERLRLRREPASLVFGKLIHEVLASLFRGQGDPIAAFEKTWDALRETDLTYGQRESFAKLRSAGRGLLELFLTSDRKRISEIQGVERPFMFAITSLPVPFLGVIDLIADVDGLPTVVDFKTAASAYEPHEAALSDQLTAYYLAAPEAVRAALCVLLKTKEPRIAWHFASRRPGQLFELIEKARLVAKAIEAGHFYKRPGKWCGWCDYLPVCLGDRKKADETLIKVP